MGGGKSEERENELDGEGYRAEEGVTEADMHAQRERERERERERSKLTAPLFFADGYLNNGETPFSLFEADIRQVRETSEKLCMIVSNGKGTWIQHTSRSDEDGFREITRPRKRTFSLVESAKNFCSPFEHRNRSGYYPSHTRPQDMLNFFPDWGGGVPGSQFPSTCGQRSGVLESPRRRDACYNISKSCYEFRTTGKLESRMACYEDLKATCLGNMHGWNGTDPPQRLLVSAAVLKAFKTVTDSAGVPFINETACALLDPQCATKIDVNITHVRRMVESLNVSKECINKLFEMTPAGQFQKRFNRRPSSLHLLRMLATEAPVCTMFYAPADLPLYEEAFDSMSPGQKWAPQTQPVRRTRRNCGKGWLYRTYTEFPELVSLGATDEDACSAFSLQFQSIPSSGREVCIDCTAGIGGPWGTLAALALGAIAVLGIFFLVVVLYPEQLKQSICTVLIIGSHLITYELIMGLDLSWPLTARKAAAGTIQALAELDLTAAMSPCIGLPSTYMVLADVMLTPLSFLFFGYIVFTLLLTFCDFCCLCACLKMNANEDQDQRPCARRIFQGPADLFFKLGGMAYTLNVVRAVKVLMALFDCDCDKTLVRQTAVEAAFMYDKDWTVIPSIDDLTSTSVTFFASLEYCSMRQYPAYICGDAVRVPPSLQGRAWNYSASTDGQKRTNGPTFWNSPDPSSRRLTATVWLGVLLFGIPFLLFMDILKLQGVIPTWMTEDRILWRIDHMTKRYDANNAYWQVSLLGQNESKPIVNIMKSKLTETSFPCAVRSHAYASSLAVHYLCQVDISRHNGDVLASE